MKYIFHRLILSLFLCLAAFFTVSCDMINEPVKAFFTGAGKELGLSAGTSTDNPSNNSNSTDNTDNTDKDNSDDDGGETTPDDTEFDTIDTEVSFVMYVSAEGDDANDGSKENPLKTIDKALSTLKTNFQADTAKTAGYVLLLSDFEIASEINLENYNFGELSPNIVELTIAGYGGIRTLDAKSNCRVMKVGFTNGAINLKNLKFKGGYSDDVGGAGLYVSSSGFSSASAVYFKIRKCIFTENMSSQSGAAVSLQSDYSFYFYNCEISNNRCSDGASAIDITKKTADSTYIIYDTVISDNTTVATADPSTPNPVYNYGYAINTDGLANLILQNNTVIKNNTIRQVSSDAGADYSKLCVLKTLKSLGNKVAVSNNSVYLDDGTTLTRNLVLDTSAGEKITIEADCSGSSIGIKASGSITGETVFTTNYKATTPVSPASVFVCDGDYGIGYSSDGEEAAFVLSGGSFTNPLDNTMTFGVSTTTLTGGTGGTITVTPLVKNKAGDDITSSVLSDIIWRLTLYNGSTEVTTSSTNELTVSAAQALPDSYRLYIQATLNGITSDDTTDITITPAP